MSSFGKCSLPSGRTAYGRPLALEMKHSLSARSAGLLLAASYWSSAAKLIRSCRRPSRDSGWSSYAVLDFPPGVYDYRNPLRCWGLCPVSMNTWRNRHHRGSASLAERGAMPVTSSPQNEWRSPTGGDTLSFADVQYSPSEKENATHGQVYRTGRSRVKLHGGHAGPERAAIALAGGGDERRGVDRGPARDCRHPASVPGGRDPRGLARPHSSVPGSGPYSGWEPRTASADPPQEVRLTLTRSVRSPPRAHSERNAPALPLSLRVSLRATAPVSGRATQHQA